MSDRVVDDPRVVRAADGAGVTWPALARHLPAIRAHLRDRLALAELGSDDVDDVVLAVNEAVTNAVEHAYGPGDDGTVTVTVRIDRTGVRIDVADHGSWRRPPRDPGDRGHGFPLMRGLVDAVSVRHAPGGTMVRLDLTLPVVAR